MFKKTKAFLSVILAGVMLSSCAAKGSSSSEDESSSKAQSTTKATVTLPQDSSSAPEEDSSSEENAADSGVTPLMWKVTNDEGNELILIGSMHALADECYPLPDRVMKAYENAEVIACELDVVTAANDLAKQLEIMNESTYEDNAENIALHLSKETVDGLTGFFEAKGYSMDMLKHYKPWYLSLQCDNMIMADCKLDSQVGLDSYILQKAHEDGKEIYEVESYDFQMDLLMNFSDELYDLLLSEYTVENIDLLKENLTKTYELWKKGDIKDQALAIEILYSCAMGIKNYYNNVKKPEKIRVRNKYAYPIKLKELKKHISKDNINEEKKILKYYKIEDDEYAYGSTLAYLNNKKSYEAYLHISDDDDTASGLFYKEIKNKFLAYIYYYIICILAYKKNIKKISDLLDKTTIEQNLHKQ